MLGNSICFQGNLGANGMKIETHKIYYKSYLNFFLCKKSNQLKCHLHLCASWESMDTGVRMSATLREPLKRTHGDTVIGRNLQFAREEIGVTDFTVYMTDNQLLQLEFS
jgi:hypothetical protein